MTAQLRRDGTPVGRERVRRLMREEGLVVVPKRRWVRTTQSDHGHKIWPNLAKDLTPPGIDQLWVADLTYIALARGFVYLAAILDAYSRRVIGWALGATLEATLTIQALRMALATRTVQPGLVHHSDRGVQYACGDYVALLQQAGIAISMSRRATPTDNAQAESFMKTFKCEEIYLWDYTDEADVRRHAAHFIERVYNERRLHSALGYLPPAEFERQLAGAHGHGASRRLDAMGATMRRLRTTGETEAGSAGTQPARDNRPGLRRMAAERVGRSLHPLPPNHSELLPHASENPNRPWACSAHGGTRKSLTPCLKNPVHSRTKAKVRNFKLKLPCTN